MGSGDKSDVANFLVERDYNTSGVMCISIRGVAICQLIDPASFTRNDVQHIMRQICIHPMTGEYDLMLRSAASTFRLPLVSVGTFMSALTFGTRSAKCMYQHCLHYHLANQLSASEDNGASSKGCFSSSNWLPSKKTSTPQAKRKNGFALWETSEGVL